MHPSQASSSYFESSRVREVVRPPSPPPPEFYRTGKPFSRMRPRKRNHDRDAQIVFLNTSEPPPILTSPLSVPSLTRPPTISEMSRITEHTSHVPAPLPTPSIQAPPSLAPGPSTAAVLQVPDFAPPQPVGNITVCSSKPDTKASNRTKRNRQAELRKRKRKRAKRSTAWSTAGGGRG